MTVSQVMHRWIGPADLDGFPGCNDMQRHATTLGPWTSRFFTTRLEITSIFLFCDEELRLYAACSSFGTKRSGELGGVAKVRSVTECLCTSTSAWHVRDDAVIQIFSEASTFKIC